MVREGRGMRDKRSRGRLVVCCLYTSRGGSYQSCIARSGRLRQRVGWIVMLACMTGGKHISKRFVLLVSVATG